MKTTLILTGTLIAAAGCGTAKMSSRTSEQTAPIVYSEERRDGQFEQDVGLHAEQRVDGQWAREAGMAVKEWMIKNVPVPENEPVSSHNIAMAQEPEVGRGGAAQAGQDTTVSTGSGGLEVLDHAEIELRKEELVVGKREVSNGGVLVRTVVQSEEVKQPVDLRREEYVIERIPAGSARDQQARAENAFQGREIYIPLMKEEPVTSKRTVLTESIRLGKRVETDQQTVTWPVRSEDVEVVKNPNLTDPKFATVPHRSTGAGAMAATGGTAYRQNNNDTLKLAREEFVVGKEERDNGGVYLQKVIRTETASQPVELRREEYNVERQAIAGEVASSDFTPRQIQLGLAREEAVPSTRNYVAETIRVRKQVQTDQQMVSGTVRKESAEIVRLTDSAVLGQGGTGLGGQSGVTTLSESGAGMTKDELLSQSVRSTLAAPNGANASYSNIDVSSESGVVTLRGTVSTEAEKKLLAKRVKQLSGVRSVNNEIRIVKP